MLTNHETRIWDIERSTCGSAPLYKLIQKCDFCFLKKGFGTEVHGWTMLLPQDMDYEIKMTVPDI